MIFQYIYAMCTHRRRPHPQQPLYAMCTYRRQPPVRSVHAHTAAPQTFVRSVYAKTSAPWTQCVQTDHSLITSYGIHILNNESLNTGIKMG